MRADGTQTDKANATVGGAAGAALSVAGFNAETFAAGDTIIFESGTYTDQVTLPSSGSAGNKITYTGVASSVPVIDLSANAADAHAILVDGNDYLNIDLFDLRGSGGAGALRLQGAAGAGGDGFTIEVDNVRVLSNYGASDATNNHDGFSLDNTAQAIFNSPYARGCREDPASTGSHQAFALHGTAKAVFNAPDVADCNWACVCTADSQATINGGTLDCSIMGSFDLSSTVTADGFIKATSTAIVISGTAKPPFGSSTTSAAALVQMIGGSITATGTGAIASNRNHARFVDVAFDINQTTWRIQTFGAGARIDVEGGEGAYTNSGGFFWREEPGGQLNITSHHVTTVAADTLAYYANTTAGTGQGRFEGNLVEEFGSAVQVLWVAAACVVPPDIGNNVFKNASAGGEAVDNDMAASGPVVKNNVFVNVTKSVMDAGGADIDYNCYYNSGDSGGSNSVTTDPGLNSDYIAQNLMDAGINWWFGMANPVGYDGEPIADWSPSIGAVQSQTVPFHPKNL